MIDAVTLLQLGIPGNGFPCLCQQNTTLLDGQLIHLQNIRSSHTFTSYVQMHGSTEAFPMRYLDP